MCFEGDEKQVVNFFGQEKCTTDKIMATPMFSVKSYVSCRVCVIAYKNLRNAFSFLTKIGSDDL